MNERLPPGQRWIDEPIVFDIAHVPPIALSEATLRLAGDVENEIVLAWEDLEALPRTSGTVSYTHLRAHET